MIRRSRPQGMLRLFQFSLFAVYLHFTFMLILLPLASVTMSLAFPFFFPFNTIFPVLSKLLT